MGDFLRQKPHLQIEQSLEVSPELLFADFRFFAIAVNKYTGSYRVLVDIDAATTGI
jgi:hypothetical protein